MIEKKEEENGNFPMEIIMTDNSNKICHMEMEDFIRKPS